MINQLIKGSIILLIIFLIALLVAFIYAYNEIKIDMDKIVNYHPKISSVILDSKGNKIANVMEGEHRLYAKYSEIPGHLIEALIAIEDTRFFEHNGINPDAIIRAAIRNYRAGKKVEGGSTITQQLVKKILLSPKKSYTRKLKEAILAIKVENELTKEQILERYLNEISYGSGYFGVKTAAKGYFHKDLSELTLKEIALLVGLPNAPSFYNPRRHLDRALNRANTILNRMRKLGWISDIDYNSAIKEIPKIYKGTLTQNIAPYITDEVIRRLKSEFPDIKSGGYKIHTTIDLQEQKLAKEALLYAYNKALKRYRKYSLNGAFLVVDNDTGDIKAMIGGVDYKKSAFNRVTMMERQPGSAFKPFLYQIALDLGYNPATELTDVERTFQYYKNGKRVIWKPKNYEQNFAGFIKLRDALVISRNLATINLVAEIGVDKVLEKLKPLKIKHVPHDLSISLGNLGISPVKMAEIYSVFANGGHMIEPRLISKVVSKDGTTIYEAKNQEIADFTKPEQAYLMTDILKDVIKRGTGRKAQVPNVEVAGKTGTTNRNVDAWFCGYSPAREVIVWFGRDNNRPIGKNATGGVVAAPAFAYFFKRLYALRPDLPREFIVPDGVYNTMDGVPTELYTDISPLPTKDEISTAKESPDMF